MKASTHQGQVNLVTANGWFEVGWDSMKESQRFCSNVTHSDRLFLATLSKLQFLVHWYQESSKALCIMFIILKVCTKFNFLASRLHLHLTFNCTFHKVFEIFFVYLYIFFLTHRNACSIRLGAELVAYCLLYVFHLKRMPGISQAHDKILYE